MKASHLLLTTFVTICLLLSMRTSYAQCYGTTSVCVNSSGSYQYSGSSSKIRWSISGGGTIVGSTAAKSISVTWTAPGTRYVYLTDLMNSSGDCSITVTVKDAIGGTLSPGNTTICQGSSQSLSLSGHMGTVVRWEKSENGGAWQTISTTSTSYTATNIQMQTSFRALISNCSKQVYSGTQTTYVEAPNPGTISIISGSSVFCDGSSTSGTLQLNNYSGDIRRWEKSELIGGVWSSWTTAGGADINFTFSASIETRYRAVVRSLVCYDTPSNYFTITKTPGTTPGVISANKPSPICSNETFSLTLSGNVGSVTRWEIWDEVHGWYTLNSPTNVSITMNSQFRAVVQNGSCPSLTTNTISMEIFPPVVAGSIGSNQTICYNSDVAVFTNAGNPSGGSGVYSYQWQIRTPGGTWSDISGANGITYDHGTLSAVQEFRRAVSSCGLTAYTSSVLVSFFSAPDAGAIGNDQTICYNGDVAGFTNAANPSGGSGIYSYQWQIRTPGGTWSNISGANSITYDHGTLTSAQEFRRAVISCQYTAYTPPVTVSLYSAPTGGSISGEQTICSNSDVAPFLNVGNPTGGNGNYTYQWQRRLPGGAWSNISGATGITYDHGILSATEEFRRAVISCGLTGYTNHVTVITDQPSDGGTVGPSAEAYGSISGSLALAGHLGQIEKWQKRLEAGSWIDVPNTSTTLNYTNLSNTTIYQVLVKNGTCPPNASNEVTISIYPVPTFQIIGDDHVSPGGSTTLVTDQNLYSYEWFRNNVLVAGESAFQMIVRKPGAYKVKVKRTATSNFYTTGEIIVGEALDDQPVQVNYIKTTDFLEGGVSSETDIYELNVSNYRQTVQYFDGLGRPIQTVTLGESPSGNDIVQPVTYDIYGREAKKYLMYSREVRDGRYVTDALAEQNSFYQSGQTIATDANPFAETVFESSPLNRILKSGAPGATWQPNSDPYSLDDKTVKTRYQANGTGEVLLFQYDPTTRRVTVLQSGIIKHYDPNTLQKTETYDEHSSAVVEYADMQGRVVLKRVQAQSVQTPVDDNNYASTYYIYDDFGNLVTVLQPEGVKQLSSYHHADGTSQEAFLSRWAFRYRYDHRKRLIEKQVPGAEPVYMVYDDRDRLVLTQDGNQRKATPNEWTFTKYDALNRPILTGIYKDAMDYDQSAMQGVVNAFYASAPPAKWYEEFKCTGAIVHGYTNQSFPNVSAESDYLTITYYDSHDFVNAYAGSDYDYVSFDLAGQPSNPFPRVNGRVAGSRTKVLNTSEFLWSAVYYDDRYRPVQEIKQNHKGGFDRITTVYDFAGKVLKTKSIHSSVQIGSLVTVQANEYDHAGRLLSVYQDLNPSAEVEPIQWTNLNETLVTGSSITKSSAGSSWGNSGAFSINSIPSNTNGSVEFSVTNALTIAVVGLSDSDVDPNYSSIDFAIHPEYDSKLYIFENGVNRGQFGTYAVGDVFTIERKYGRIYYKKNGSMLYISTSSFSGPLYADCALYNNSGSITNAVLFRDPGTQLLLVSNKYNELGQLIDKGLVGPINNYIQSVDYRYNIRGWLTSINNAQLDQESLTNDDKNDLFGMELLYNNLDAALGNTGMYNGNISAVKWKTPIHGVTPLEDRKGYVYSYDPLNRLTQASFAAYNTQAGWSAEANTFDESLTYDLNGNIKTLQRSQAKAGVSSFSIVPQRIDQLDYTYQNGNQLSQVKDLSLHKGGFKDGATHSNEFLYDDNGNLIKDLNKGIDSISYNHLNLPDLITFSNGNTIQYTYDATGAKLKQTVTDTTAIKVTDYIGNMVYERDTLQFFSVPEGRVVNNGGDYDYQFMLKDHLGNTRTLFGNPYEGSNMVGDADCNTLNYFLPVQNVTASLSTIDGENYIKYHANQTWSTPGMLSAGGITVKAGEKYTYKVKGYRANHPTSQAYLYVWGNAGDLLWRGAVLPYGRENEGWVFNDFTIPDGVTVIRLGVLWDQADGLAVGDVFYLNEVAVFKHNDDDYPAGFEVSDQAAEYYRFAGYDPGKINNSGAYSRTGNSAYLLSASTQVPNQVIGPAKSFRVYPGDAVHMEVHGRYLSATTNGTDVGAVIAGALHSAFNLSAGGGTDVAFQSISNLFGDGAIIGTLAHPYENAAPPKAFLNYILFDDNYVPYDFGYDQIGTEGAMPGSTSDKMSLVAKVSKPGYIYIYLSNENEVVQEVYFDDLAIKHVKGVAIQQNDYYPFGLAFNSYQRENTVEQRWKFQGQEHIDDFGLNWDSFKWRNHQPDIGRFFSVDPLAEKYVHNSPYAFSENKVTAHVELEGLEAESIKKIGRGFVGVADKMTSSDTYQEISRGFGKLAEKMGLKNLLFSKNIPRDDGPPRQQDGNNLIIHDDGPPGPDHKNAATPDPEGDTYDVSKDVIDATGKITKPTVRATPKDIGERAENFASGVESGVEAGKTFVKDVMTDKGDNVNLEVKDVKNRADAKNFGWVTITTTSGRDSAVQVSNH